MKWMPMVPLKRVSACLSGNPSYTESFLITPIINSSHSVIPSLKLTVRSWKLVGRLLSFWGPVYFQASMLVSGRVYFLKFSHSSQPAHWPSYQGWPWAAPGPDGESLHLTCFAKRLEGREGAEREHIRKVPSLADLLNGFFETASLRTPGRFGSLSQKRVAGHEDLARTSLQNIPSPKHTCICFCINWH